MLLCMSPFIAHRFNLRAEAGDLLIVARLDRLARSTRDLLNILHQLAEKGAKFKSLHDPWCDTSTPQGELLVTILAGFATVERHLIKARTDDGRKRAKARGVRFGRPGKLDQHQRQEALQRLANGETLVDVARTFGVIQLLLVGSTALSCRQAWPRDGAKIIALHRTVADAVQRLLAQLGGNVRQRGVRLAWLNQRDIFVGVRSAERIKNTFSDDAPILNFCRTFGHHRSPSPANQYCRCRALTRSPF